MLGPKCKDLNAWLFRSLPELEPVYQEEFEYWADSEPPGPHVVYGNVLIPHMLHLLAEENPEQGRQQLKRVFAPLEEMAHNSDAEVRNVLIDTICWYLTGRPELYDRAKPHMGPRTRELCRTTEP